MTSRRLIGCLVLGLACALSGRTLAAEIARPADAVVDSLGINTHASFTGWLYDDWDSVTAAIKDIGFRYVRDIPDDYTRLNQLSAATGAKIVAIAQDGSTRIGAIEQSLYPTVLQRLKNLTHLAYIEGPNEPDQTGDPDWSAKLTWWQQKLYTDVKADPALMNKPVIAPVTGDFATLKNYADLGNVHCYPDGHPPTHKIDNYLNYFGQQIGNKPMVATETGYITVLWTTPNPNVYGVSETAQARYMPRLVMEYFNRGVLKTIPYELLDDLPDDPPQQANYERHFGLLRSDFTYKPAAVALKNLMKLLADPGGEFTPSSLDFTLTGGDSTLHHTLLQKRDGTYWLALWQDALLFDYLTNADLTVPKMPVTLTLNEQVKAARLYLPNDSDSALAAYQDVTQLNLQVPADVMLVQLDFTGVTVPEPAGLAAVALVALLLRRPRRP